MWYGHHMGVARWSSVHRWQQGKLKITIIPQVLRNCKWFLVSSGTWRWLRTSTGSLSLFVSLPISARRECLTDTCSSRDHSASATYFCKLEPEVSDFSEAPVQEEWLSYRGVPKDQKEFHFRNPQVQYSLTDLFLTKHGRIKFRLNHRFYITSFFQLVFLQEPRKLLMIPLFPILSSQ